jgi:hypothetical protein
MCSYHLWFTCALVGHLSAGGAGLPRESALSADEAWRVMMVKPMFADRWSRTSALGPFVRKGQTFDDVNWILGHSAWCTGKHHWIAMMHFGRGNDIYIHFEDWRVSFVNLDYRPVEIDWSKLLPKESR